MPIDDPIVIAAFAGASILLVSAVVGTTAYVVMRPRMRLKRRLASIGISDSKGREGGGQVEARRQRRIQDKIQQAQERKQGQKSRTDLRHKLMQAGLDLSVRDFVMASIIVGLLATGAAILAGVQVIAAPGVGLFAGLGLPRFILGYISKRRRKQFTSMFADAIDVVVRGIRSGLPVTECIAIIGREFDEPVGEEFRLIVEGEKLGMTLEEILRRGLERMPTSEFKFFSIVLQVQRQTGGNLAETLGNLSHVLRERKKMRDKVTALASEAKSSAMIIASLPFFVMAMLSILNPAYLMQLFIDPIGNYMLAGGATWMGLGVLIMSKMINFEM